MKPEHHRSKHFALLLCVALILGAPPAAYAQPCGFCERFEMFEPELKNQLVRIAADRKLFRTPISATLLEEPVCGAAARFPSLEDYGDLSTTYFDRAEAAASKVEQCETQCRPAVNRAEVCTLYTSMHRDLEWLSRSEGAFLTAELLIEAAETQGVSFFRSLANANDVAVRSALGLIAARTAEILEPKGGQTNLDEEGILLTELSDIALVMLGIDDFGLASGQMRLLGETLMTATERFGEVSRQAEIAMTRALVLNPNDRDALIQDFLVVASEMAWVAHALNTVAVQFDDARIAEVNTNAAIETDTGLAAATKSCFAKAGLGVAVAREALLMHREILASCGSFEGCHATESHHTGFAEFLVGIDMADKNAHAVTNSICQLR